MVCVDGRVLLGMKKRGFGAGRWNGFGGKVEEGETLEEAARRELTEEVGIYAKDMRKVGILELEHESDHKPLEMHIFTVTDFSGEPIESEEMRPEWFAYDAIPFKQMWPDDAQWFPYLLGDKLFRGAFCFDRPSDAEYTAKILSQEIAEVDNL